MSASSLISLPLLKYSSTAQQSEPFHWVHISSPDLFVVFDSLQPGHHQHGDFAPARLLKVVRGTELLETVDIVSNVQQADAVLADARKRNRHLRIHELPISAMIRPGTPIVAVKHSPPDRMARRFQLRFSSGDDFRTAHSIVCRAGIQISESPALPKPASRASSTHSAPNFTSSLPPSSPPKVDVWHARQETRRPVSSALSAPQLPALVERVSFRPSTAPTTDLGRPGQIPPRRELPFPRPPSSSTQSLPGSRTHLIDDTDQHRRNSLLASSADLPSLVPPRLARPSNRDTVPSAITAFGTGGSDLEQHHQVEQLYQGMNDPNPLQKHLPPSSAAAVPWQRRPINANAMLSDRVEAEHSVGFDFRAYPPQSGEQSVKPSARDISRGDNFQTRTTRDMAPSWDADLLAYLDQSVSDREHQLDGIFAHCIHDDNFLLLCQDVASRWHRCCLGSI